MEDDRLVRVEKLVMIAHLLYEGNPAPEQIAKAACASTEQVRIIDRRLVSIGWLKENIPS